MRISDWSSDVCSSDLAFMEATGRDAAALAGHGLAELREAKLCPRPGSNGRTIEARPLYDRNGRRRHWLVVQPQKAPPPAAAPGRSGERRGGKEGGSPCRSRWWRSH